MNTVNIFWTGGWDSTFRMIELSRQEVIVRSIYILDTARSSFQYEIDAMEAILASLRERKETNAVLLPLEIINKDTVPSDNEVTESFRWCREICGIGTQYDWLARFAKQQNYIELGIELDDPSLSGAIRALKYGKLKKTNLGPVVDADNSRKEIVDVFGHFVFPIIDKTENDMLKIVKEWGYQDVMSKTWFCHSPIHGKPCGVCNPCKTKMESNMEFLLPEESQKKYRTMKRLSLLVGHKIAHSIMKFSLSQKQNRS